MNLYGFAGGDPVNFHDPFGLKVCFKGSRSEIRQLRAGVEDATDTRITLDADSCVEGFEARGAEGFEKLQDRFGVLVASAAMFTVGFADESRHFYSHYDARTQSVGIIRGDVGGFSYRTGNAVTCFFGGSGFDYATLGSLVAHELLGHAAGARSERAAIRVENAYHRARGRAGRC